MFLRRLKIWRLGTPVRLFLYINITKKNYALTGDTLNIEGGNWRRLEDAQDGSMNWEQID